MVKCSSPILILAFNRPDTTSKVIESLKLIEPTKLYIAIDGPRKDKVGEFEKCQEVIELFQSRQWCCDVKYLIHVDNLGCKNAVTSAISWVFENEDRAIIIEDDIVAARSFFKFADEMLERYQSNEQIGMITANNYTPIQSLDEDYCFSKYTHIWGWATWKRVWDKFDVNMTNIVFDGTDWIGVTLIESEVEKDYYAAFFKNVFNKLRSGSQNAWGPQFLIFNLINRHLVITPKVNLAMNIGIESSRDDANSRIFSVHFRPIDEEFEVKKHPEKIELNRIYDKIHFRDHINRKETFLSRLARKLFRYFM